MTVKTSKQSKKLRRIKRIRSAIRSPHIDTVIMLHCSNRHLSSQAVRVSDGKILLSVASNEKTFPVKGKNKQSAQKLGELMAERVLKAGIEKIIFDRRGKKYHGRVADFCEAARAKGLKF